MDEVDDQSQIEDVIPKYLLYQFFHGLPALYSFITTLQLKHIQLIHSKMNEKYIYYFFWCTFNKPTNPPNLREIG